MGKRSRRGREKERNRERKSVGMISLETSQDTIENVRGEAREKEKAKDIKSVS